MFEPKIISYIGITDFRDIRHKFGIFQADRFMHTYILGKTTSGKSNLILTLCLQDIKRNNAGVFLCDVHGDLIETLLQHIPEHRKKDIIYLDIPNPKLVIGYNPIKKVNYEMRSLVASGILESFKKLWSSSWGLRLENLIRMALLALLDQPKANLKDILRILQDSSYRQACIPNIVNPEVKRFFTKELPQLSSSVLHPVLSKLGSLLVHPSASRFLIDNPDSLSLFKAMNEKKIVLVNLNKGRLGGDVTHILGSILISGIYNSSLARVILPETKRVPFHVYLDEFQYYTTNISDMFSELRKFKVSLNIAHHYLQEISDNIRHGILGNVGTVICFRIGANDAEFMTRQQFKEYSPLSIGDYVYLPNRSIIISLMIDGKPSKPFTAKTLYYKDIL
ncbi:DUF87 domain-containing protein [Olleya sp. UBA1516]|uniref:type IV secretory system conjugative DNA transfer family protein n=1 Tax=Olleya sp. UBA1516 TaxID=1947013 RepID=UPI0025E1C521|nr:DUF87 domain-containing protein [Olleya sp. UBA1516]|tara:strand:+ start:6177 stop:7355 length:1179 start_codon:yes stop_codon:yes gene_type:complete